MIFTPRYGSLILLGHIENVDKSALMDKQTETNIRDNATRGL